MKTTLSAIRAHKPCASGWTKLLAHLGKTAADDEPLLIETILDSNGLNDALWCLRAVGGHDREIRLYAAWCARQVQHLMKDPRSIEALEVTERFARGRATAEELAVPRAAAWAAAGSATAARAAAWAAARAAWAAAGVSAAEAAAAAAAAAEAARAAAAGEAAAEAARAAAWAAAWEAAAEATRTTQTDELRRVCREIDSGRDPYPEENGR